MILKGTVAMVIPVMSWKCERRHRKLKAAGIKNNAELDEYHFVGVLAFPRITLHNGV